ncbi:TIM barrel protein [Jejubacter calystegiae]|uniref:TIM barrel protein n=1 Tax=Jejubacter calystegiae TaxID=2579935 RepID=A0A4P8YGN5_9ENTR|nr:TIM barrel protein [Jejubacter calystegiae]QCT19083.1 TIM barrel protein [Jejubacter calystegiae]
MLRFAANLTMLYPEYPFLERFDRAAADGFQAVEFFFPYGTPAETFSQALERNQQELVLFNMPLGDWDAGERGFASQPSRCDDFRAGLDQAVAYGKALRPPRINCPSGPEGNDAQPWPTLVENMTMAARALADIDVQLVVEPINRNDVPGAVISNVEQALALFEKVDSDNIAIQFDLWHSLRAGEDPFSVLKSHMDRIAHIQIADVPGRHQPGTGEVDFEKLFTLIDNSGYQGWVSLEYHPQGGTQESFSTLRQMGILG